MFEVKINKYFPLWLISDHEKGEGDVSIVLKSLNFSDLMWSSSGDSQVGVGNVVEQHIGVSIAQLTVPAHVTPAITREIVYLCHVDDQMGFTCKVDVLNLQVALLSSTAGGDVAAVRGETGALDDLF